MKYLKLFEELEKSLYKKLYNNIKNISYILTDEGYTVGIDLVDYPAARMPYNIEIDIKRYGVSEEESNKDISFLFEKDFYKEYIDRLKDLCQEFDKENGTPNLATPFQMFRSGQRYNTNTLKQVILISLEQVI